MSVINKQAYGIGNPVFGVMQKPIISSRDPRATDKAQLGTEWINSTSDAVFFLTSVAAGAANWVSVAGGAGFFSSLVVEGDITSNTGNIEATLGGVSALTTVTAGTGISTTAGNIIASNGDIVASNGNFAAGNGQINTASSILLFNKSRAAGIVNSGDNLGLLSFFGNDGAGSSQGANILAITNGTIGAGRMPTYLLFSTAPDAVSATVERLRIPADGGLVIAAPTTATTPPLVLPGPIFMYTGAGAPANPLAVHIGDLYIRTDAVSAVTRMYIATAVGAWTNVTCAA